MSDLATLSIRFSGDKKRLYEMLLKEEGVRVPQAEAIPRRNDDLLPPLSFAQLRLWLLDQLGSSNAYHVPLVRRFIGDLNVTALQASLIEVVKRHEVLRTSFPAIDGDPRQLIHAAEEFQLEQLDLSHLPLEESQDEARRLAAAKGLQRAFDLENGPLVRALLIKLAEQDHVFLVSLHHIVADGWSMGVLFNELATLYNAFRCGAPSPLTELPIQYADYAVWQREHLQGAVLARQVDYWKQQLNGVPVLELPVDRMRSPEQNQPGGYESFLLPIELARELQNLGRREGATLFMVLLAAFQLLLSRYSGQEDIVLGTSIAGRNQKETEGLIGFFVNTLALRTDLSGNPGFRDLLRRVSKVALEAYAHQDLPFQKLVEELQPDRSVSHQPIIQAFFSLQNTPTANLQMDGLKFRPFRFGIGYPQFDLMLVMNQSARGISGTFSYRTDLFAEETIRTMAKQYQTLLRAAVEKPDKPVKQLTMLSSEEWRQTVHQWNETASPKDEDRRLHELFEEQVKRTPERVAVVSKDETLSYRELNERANRLAHWLIAQGVGPESIVGILLDRSTALPVSLLAVLKAGAAYLPLDRHQPGERLSFMLQDAGAGVLLSNEALVDELPDYWGQIFCLDRDLDELEEMSGENPGREVTGENLAYVIYTSGSTGKPKGVMIEHRSLSNYLAWARGAYPLADGQGAPVHSSISFDLTVTSIYAPLLSGGWVELLDEADAVTELGITLARQGDYTLVKLTPAHLEVLRWRMSGSEAARASRCLVVGGEQLRRETVLWWRQHAPETRIFNEYGPTEATVGCCVFEVGDEETSSSRTIAIGRPIANTRLYILDEQRNPVGIGVRGELYIGGLGLGRGYIERADLTAERFLPDHLSGVAGERLYQTGDMARYRPNGVIEYLGRVDGQVKLRGYRIELAEIETALREHGGVKESIVLVRENEAGDKRLVAYVVAEPGMQLEVNTLRSHLKTKLPDYMTPSNFRIVSELPLTANGKVDTQALLALEQDTSESSQEYVPPSTAIEEAICDIWVEVLKLTRVGIHENFFEIGGHSLLAVQVIARMLEVFGVEISLRTFFEAPTVAKLSEVLIGELLEREGSDNVLKMLDELDELEVVA